MKLLSTLLALALTTSTTLASPLPLPQPIAQLQDPSGGATCGRTSYTSSAIAAAVSAACTLLQQGSGVGRDSYPHAYEDREGFTFPVSGPWYEFPIMKSGRIFDGSTGPDTDRVVIDDGCDLAGVLTHTGAKQRNGFVACDTGDDGDDSGSD